MNFHSLKPGTSVAKERIEAFSSASKAKKFIYLMAGVHGDEVEGVYVLEQLFNWLKEEEAISCPLIVIPILNIDGYKNRSRVNSNGVDLNRNFPTENWTKEFTDKQHNPGAKPLSEPENQFLVSLFQKYSPGLVLTFHSWKPLLNFNGDCMELAQGLSKHNGYEVVPDIGYPTPGSLGTYGPKEHQAPVLTFECPRLSEDLGLQKIWDENEQGLKELFHGQSLQGFL